MIKIKQKMNTRQQFNYENITSGYKGSEIIEKLSPF